MRRLVASREYKDVVYLEAWAEKLGVRIEHVFRSAARVEGETGEV
jgi:hypothetical protein